MKGRQSISCRQPVKLAINSNRLEENVSGRDGMAHASPPLDPLAHVCLSLTKILATPLCYRTKFRCSMSNHTNVINGEKIDLSRPAFQGHSRSLEPTRIDRLPKTSRIAESVVMPPRGSVSV